MTAATGVRGGRLAAARATLQAVFADIATTRMRDLPIVNPRLQVEAIDLQPWQGRVLGVLITPWAINLVLLEGKAGDLPVLPLGEQQAWSFPSGVYAFMGFQDPRLGPCQTCPLFSPVHEFASQEEARLVAREVLSALLQPTSTAASNVPMPAAVFPAASLQVSTAQQPPASPQPKLLPLPAVPPQSSLLPLPAVAPQSNALPPGGRRAFLRAILPGR